MGYRFLLHKDRCSACAACVIGCLDKTNAPFPLRRTEIRELPQPDGSCRFEYVTLSCLHCSDAPCAAACTAGCIHRDEKTGFVVVERSCCIGCGNCLAACPADIPRLHPDDGKMIKCDGCADLVGSGMAPACVKACPYGALEVVAEADYDPVMDALSSFLL